MNCVYCGSKAVTERPEVTARGYRRFRCRDCGRQFNERSGGVLNRTCLPSDIIAFVVLDAWLADARPCDASAIATFAAGLQTDDAAVRAAFTQPWSSGQAEGQINRLKLFKR